MTLPPLRPSDSAVLYDPYSSFPLSHPMVRPDLRVAQQPNLTQPLPCMYKWVSKGAKLMFHLLSRALVLAAVQAKGVQAHADQPSPALPQATQEWPWHWYQAEFGLRKGEAQAPPTGHVSHSDIVLPSDNNKTCRCMHEHWKNCQDYPEAHQWVGKDPEYDEEEQVRALVWAQETDEENYLEGDEALRIAQLASGMLVHAEPSSAGTSITGCMKVM
ncbi:hypothetical protein EI94DRAFT_1821711 [Lactarius quietus]|nr:hypothetical protein EI94DRAFT_1821711 [Lactarius quietus]